MQNTIHRRLASLCLAAVLTAAVGATGASLHPEVVEARFVRPKTAWEKRTLREHFSPGDMCIDEVWFRPSLALQDAIVLVTPARADQIVTVALSSGEFAGAEGRGTLRSPAPGDTMLELGALNAGEQVVLTVFTHVPEIPTKRTYSALLRVREGTRNLDRTLPVRRLINLQDWKRIIGQPTPTPLPS